MTHPDIRAALGRERLNTLLADAEAVRKALQARLYRRQAATPARRGSPLWRRAGSAVVIRPVHSSDAPLFADGFTRLSAESRRMRFLRPEDKLSPAEPRYPTTAGHHDHQALSTLDDRTRRGGEVARHARHADDRQTAEIAAKYVGSVHR